jgi:general secretion pathway protein D
MNRDRHRSGLGFEPLAVFAVALLFVLLGVCPAAADDPPADPKAGDGATEGAKPDEPKPPLEFHNEQLIEKADGSVVYFYRTNFVKPSQLAGSLNTLGIGNLGVALKPFDTQNQLVLEGLPEAVEILIDAIGYFDVSAPQVFIETEVIEITWNSDFEFGLDWEWLRSPVGPDTLFQGTSGVLNPPSFLSSTFPPFFPFQGSGLGFGFTGSNAEKYGPASMTLQALQINGKAEVLSRPSIVATQGIQASVSTEEKVPIARFDNADNNVARFRYDNLTSGVTLKVTAQHIGDIYVTLNVEPLVKGLQGVAANRLSGAFAPITTERKASTTVTLADGETLVIGGLYTNSSVKEKAKTPILSDLPILGDILTRTRETKRKTELVFLLTPRIIRKNQDLKIVIPPSEVRRLEEGDETKPKCPEFKLPFGIRKPGAYLDELDD